MLYPHNSIVCSITNQKGGVAKTTTAINLAAALALMGKKTLLIDLDAQGNASTGSNAHSHTLSTTDLLLENRPINECILQTNYKYDILPANATLTHAEVELMKRDQREFVLQKQLSKLTQGYDFILIDCPPSLNILTINALVASHHVLIPVQCEYFALEGVMQLLKTIESIKKTVNQNLNILGLLRTMYDGRNRLAREVSEQLLLHFSSRVFNTIIPRNVRLAESPSHSKPVIQYDRRSQGAIAYIALAGEISRQLCKSTTPQGETYQ
ncbi:MAG TPA: ParA family protein [Gammaproteobacteria bacterium]|nr:ParA family protein [Gammaproteobacteria bacterium]